MKPSEIAVYRDTLLALLAEIDGEDQAGAAAQGTVHLDQQAVGRLSRMDALQQQAMAKATQARRDGRRLRLRAALDRLEDGEFGYCVDCGEAIEPDRLALDPSLPKCLSCTRG